MVADQDRNLLFGTYALRLDLLSSEALAEGMLAWSKNKSQSLGAILVAQGAIQAYDVEHVNQLIDQETTHAKVSLAIGNVNGNSAQGDTNVTIALASNEINALPTMVGEGGDTVARQLDGQSSVSGSLASQSTASASRFKDAKFHAAGGLGKVFSALDDEFDRRVALKEIKPEYADQLEHRTRFVWEAKITGNLEHPGVVPVYGFGFNEQGRPFYAMRFIKGKSLKEEIDAFSPLTRKQQLDPRNPEFRRLLQAFVAVCHTIHFAHSRRVLHRDIKPANMMIGAFGESLVVDWGLAKQQDAPEELSESQLPSVHRHKKKMGDSSTTQMGSAMGTPAYMSPEQAAGAWDKVNAEADIYSLGASLFHLLVGDIPIREKDVSSLLKRVEQGDFKPPREVNPAVPKPLNAICLKAMARLPADRYRSASALADDLDRWLVDQEVSVYQEDWRERANRLLRRHASKVYGIGIGSAAIFIAIIVAAMYSRSAALARREAAEEAAIADKRTIQLRQAQDVHLTDVSESLKHYPGSAPLRKSMLLDVERNFRELEADGALTPDMQLDRARNFVRLGDLERQTGERPAAQKSFQQAEALFAALRRVDPELTHEWVQSRIRRALVSKDAEDYPAALTVLAETRELLTGNSEESNEGRAYCLANEGAIYLFRDDLTKARPLLEDAAKTAEHLAPNSSADPPTGLEQRHTHDRRLRNLANIEKDLGQVLARQGKLSDGRKSVQSAVIGFTTLANSDSKHPGYLEDLALARIALADIARRQANYPEARKQFANAIEAYTNLNTALPEAAQLQERLGVVHVNFAQLFLDQGLLKEAVENGQVANYLFSLVAPQRATSHVFTVRRAAAWDVLAEAVREGSNDPAEFIAAQHFYDDSIADLTKIDSIAARETLALLQSHKAQLFERLAATEADPALKTKMLADAVSLYHESVEKLTAVAEQSKSATARHALALVQSYLGDHLYTQSPAEAEPHYQAAAQTWSALVEEETEVPPEVLNRFAWFLANCRDESQRKLLDAERHMKKAAALPNKGFKCTEALLYFRLGQYDRAAELLESMRNTAEGMEGYNAQVLATLALTRAKQGKADDAISLLKLARDAHTQLRPGNRDAAQLLEEAAALIEPSNSTETSQP